jgi:hypothetical protein
MTEDRRWENRIVEHKTLKEGGNMSTMFFSFLQINKPAYSTARSIVDTP